MDKNKIDEILKNYNNKGSDLISILQDIQIKFRYLPKDALICVSNELRVPLSRVYSVANFYSAFSLKPKGRHIISVCTGTACHVKGAGELVEELQRLLSIKAGESTKDMLFSLETVHCLGCCSLSPAININDRIYGKVKPSELKKILKDHGKE